MVTTAHCYYCACSRQLIDLHQLTFLNNRSSFGSSDLLLPLNRKSFARYSIAGWDVNQASAKNSNVYSIAINLFLTNADQTTWPLAGRWFAEESFRTALLFAPVFLLFIAESGQWVLHPARCVTLNKSFLLAYSFYNKIALNDDLPKASFDDFDKDSTVFRTQLYRVADRFGLVEF